MLIRSLIALVSVLAAVAFPTSAAAATAGECQGQIADLRTDTEIVTTFVNPNDRTGLVGKLGNASAALLAGKNAGAIQKLADFRVKVQALGSAGKLGGDDAARLDADAESAIRCIEGIGV
jgi:hypothetical protein